MRNILILVLLIPLSACAMGQKTSYEGRSDFNFQTENHGKIEVAVHDLRPYIQSENKKPNFAGILKSLYGIPYNVTTKSGEPLADDFCQLIVNTMKYRGIDATAKKVLYTLTTEEFKNGINETGDQREIYYIQMLEWKTETHFRPALHYNLKLSVFNDQGRAIAQNSEKGFFYFDKNQLGRENLATSTSSILEELFAGKKELLVDEKKQAFEKITISHVDKNNIPSEGTRRPVPENIKSKIRLKCVKDFPDDFVKQLSCVKGQESGWGELNL